MNGHRQSGLGLSPAFWLMHPLLFPDFSHSVGLGASLLLGVGQILPEQRNPVALGAGEILVQGSVFTSADLRYTTVETYSYGLVLAVGGGWVVSAPCRRFPAWCSRDRRAALRRFDRCIEERVLIDRDRLLERAVASELLSPVSEPSSS